MQNNQNVVSDLNSRPNIMFCFDIWWNQEILIWPDHKFPSSLCYCGEGPPARQPSLSRETTAVLAYPWAARFSSLPTMELLKQSLSMKHVLGKHLVLLIPPSLPPTATGSLHCSWMQPLCSAAWWAVPFSSRLWAYVINNLLPIPSVQCLVSWVWLSTEP